MVNLGYFGVSDDLGRGRVKYREGYCQALLLLRGVQYGEKVKHQAVFERKAQQDNQDFSDWKLVASGTEQEMLNAF